MAPPIVVFDLDGTLVDTAPDLLDSLNHCLDVDGMGRIDERDIRRFVGLGARVMIERAFAVQGKTLADGQLDRLFGVFLEHYAAEIPGRSRPYPGAAEAIDALAANYRLAVCTNKLETLSKRLLDALGLNGKFAAICGADTFAFRKPDPRHLTETIRRAGGDPQRALMVGDSRTDIDTAKAAGIPVVAVDFGYTDRPVAEFEPSFVISSYSQLTTQFVASLIPVPAQSARA